MLTVKTQKEITLIMNELVEKSSQIFGGKLKKVVLYGSYARGDFDEESDIDVLLSVDENKEELRKYIDNLIDLTSDIGLKYDVLLSPILISEQEFIKYKHDLPFYSNALKEGVVFYIV